MADRSTPAAADPATGALAIEARGIHKSFGSKVIFDGLDLDFRRGETLTVLGPSGCGKSVLLKLIIGLVRADAGTLRVGGVDVVGLDERGLRSIRDEVAMVFQGAALFDSMSVGENVAYGLLERAATSRDAIRERVAECLGWVGLPGSEGLPTQALSGGMRKRVGLARALATGPSIILYDEPTTGLDPGNARRIHDLIRDLQQRLHISSLVITHDIAGAYVVSDRIALIADHRVALVMDAAEARRNPPPLLESFVQGALATDDRRKAGGAR